MKKVDEKESVKIKTNIEGMPVYIVREAKRERIIRIYSTGLDAKKNGDQLHRGIVTVKTNMGHIYDIYKEDISKKWYISRMHS